MGSSRHGERAWLAAVAMVTCAAASACAAMPGESDGMANPESLSACALAVTRNVYDGPNYWGTIGIKNVGGATVKGFSVQLRVPSGAHCTNDAVPSGAALSPLNGAGTSAATMSNVCTYTWPSAKIAAGASKTFNYSTDSASFSAASDVVARAIACSGGTGSSGGSSGAGSSSGGGSGSTSGSTPGGLNPKVAPGGNFDLSHWELQEPVGSPGAPTTFSPAQLEGPSGHQDSFFFTDPTDGSMTFWDPESGVTTANSNFPRSELREMNPGGGPANWAIAGRHTLSADLKVTAVPDHVCVGQIHLGTGTPASTKPLLELFYYSSGAIVMAIEQTPAGGNEVMHPAGNAPLGARWSYVIGLSGNTMSLVIDGGATQTWTMSSTFDNEGMYFKAGDYDQSTGSSAAVGATVHFYALGVSHTP